MQDRSIERSPIPIGAVALAGTSESINRMEPLGIPLARFGAILGRHWCLLLLTMAVGAGGTAAFVTSIPKQFTAEASILIEPRRTQVSDLQAISPDPGDVTSLIRTQIDILSSPTLMTGVVEALHLDQNPEFVQPGNGLLGQLSTVIHHVIATTEPKAATPTHRQLTALAAAVLSGKVSFANELRSSVLRVMATTQSATLSAQIANELARQFLDFKRQEKFQAMQRAHDWFQEQLAELADQVRKTEGAVEQYRAQHGLLDLPADGTSGSTRTTSVTRQQLNEVASQLTQVARDRAQKEAKLAQARTALNTQQPGALPDVLMSPVITQLLSQEATLAGREAQLAASEGSGNPELVAARAQLRRLQLRVSQEMLNIVQSLSTDAQSTREQEQTLRRRMDDLRESVGAENSAEVGLQGLQAKARATRGIYDSYLTRVTQLANVAGIQEPDASLVSGAEPPMSPSAPRPLRLVSVAALLSTVLGVALACFIERVRRGFGSPEQLEVCVGIPTLALLPKASAKARRVAARGRRALKFAASLDKLRGHLRALGDERPKVIMVSSALPQEGKSVLAAGLAANTAATGWRVLLIECDFRRPSVARQFQIPSSPGLSEVLIGGTLGEDTSAVHEVSPRLHVIPAGTGTGDPQELLASNRMAQLLAAVRKQYDLVILDTPPVIPVYDGLVLAQHADATLMIVQWEKTPRTVVQDAIRLLRNSQAHFLGAVLTRVDLRRAAQSGGRPAKLYDYGSSYHTVRT